MKKISKRTKIFSVLSIVLLSVFIILFFISDKADEVVEKEDFIEKNDVTKKNEKSEGDNLNELLIEEGIELLTKENANLSSEEDESEEDESKEKSKEDAKNNNVEIISDKKTVIPKNNEEEKVVVKNKSKDVVVTENTEKSNTEMKNSKIKVTIPTNTKDKEVVNEVPKERPKDEVVSKLPPPQIVTKEETKKETENTIKIEEHLKANGYETVSSKEGNAFIVKKGNKIEYTYSEDKSLKMKFFSIKDFENDKSLETGAKMLIDLGVNMSIGEIVKSIKSTLSSETGEYITKGVTFYHTGTEIAIDF